MPCHPWFPTLYDISYTVFAKCDLSHRVTECPDLGRLCSIHSDATTLLAIAHGFMKLLWRNVPFLAPQIDIIPAVRSKIMLCSSIRDTAREASLWAGSRERRSACEPSRPTGLYYSRSLCLGSMYRLSSIIKKISLRILHLAPYLMFRHVQGALPIREHNNSCTCRALVFR